MIAGGKAGIDMRKVEVFHRSFLIYSYTSPHHFDDHTS